MLFFTQCFGAVLDLIHLRFQHYKAKRVFSAAGQLVCVVNPTHNLKVSRSVRVGAPRAGGRAFPRRARAAPAKAGPPVAGPRWSPEGPLCPCVLSGWPGARACRNSALFA